MPSPELGGGHATARVHQASRRCGGGVAARRARSSQRCRAGRDSSAADHPRRSDISLPHFRRGLNEAGYVEHRNVGGRVPLGREGRDDRLPALGERSCAIARGLGDLRRRPCGRAGGQDHATAAIPIVFTSGERPGQDRLGGELQPARR